MWAFDITPGKDASGNIVLPDPDDSFDQGLVVYAPYVIYRIRIVKLMFFMIFSRPASFYCTITPRFPGVEAIVGQTMDRHGYST